MAPTSKHGPEASRHPVDPAGLPGVRRIDTMPGFVPPESAALVEEAPAGAAWTHEIKFDGYRTLARIEKRAVKMLSRNGVDWTGRYQVLADGLARLPVEDALLDGEVVLQLPDGTTSFEELARVVGPDTSGQGARRDAPGGPGGPAGDRSSASGGRHPSRGRLLYYVFDLLYLDGYDLMGVPLAERRAVLEHLLATGKESARVLYSDDVRGDGRAVLEEACALGLEGVVSKKTTSPYRPGTRGRDWLKTKCKQRQEFVIGGYTDPAGTRTGFGALLLGVTDASGLRYVGKVGTGFDDRLLRDLGMRLRTMEIDSAPFTSVPPMRSAGKAKTHWVTPDLVAEVEFLEWTAAGSIRHPSFVGLRTDKSPADVVREVAAEAHGDRAAPRASGRRGPADSQSAP